MLAQRGTHARFICRTGVPKSRRVGFPPTIWRFRRTSRLARQKRQNGSDELEAGKAASLGAVSFRVLGGGGDLKDGVEHIFGHVVSIDVPGDGRLFLRESH